MKIKTRNKGYELRLILDEDEVQYLIGEIDEVCYEAGKSDSGIEVPLLHQIFEELQELQ